MAKTQTTVVHRLTGKRFVGIDPDGLRVLIDGEDSARTGMRPMQLVLNAVGACAAYDIVEMIRKRRIELRSYRVELEGERSEGTPAYYTRIKARHVFDAPGLDRATAERFVDLGTSKYCSVAASLRAEMEFEVVLEHESEAAEAAPEE
ncbi:MAG: OsmC family protein [Trueperaceae bacterium]